MPADDPAKLDTVATANSGQRRRMDVTATIVLLITHGLLFIATMLVLGMLVMGTDPCGYQRCGDPAWVGRALWIAFWGGIAIFITDVVVTVYRLAQHRLTYFVPMVGCLAQLALGIGAAAMESLAGPAS